MKNLTEEINKEQLGLNVLVNRITAVNIKTDDRDRLIGELQKKYPFLLQNIKDETTDNDSLTIALKDVNRLYIKRIALQSQQSKINEVLAISGENQNITGKTTTRSI